MPSRLAPANSARRAADACGRAFGHGLHELVGGATPAFAREDQDVDVFGEALHQAVALGKAGAAFEDEVAAEVLSEHA